jgi:hypothetical protein
MEGVQEGGVISSPSLMESLRAVWLTMTFIYPFQLAVFAPTLITASILPMVFALDYSNVGAPATKQLYLPACVRRGKRGQ